jgi:hypothetical protein
MRRRGFMFSFIPRGGDSEPPDMGYDAARERSMQGYLGIGRLVTALHVKVTPFYFNSLDSRRSLSGAPPVWHPGQ